MGLREERTRSQNTLEGVIKQWSNRHTESQLSVFSFRPIVAMHLALFLKEVEPFRLLSKSTPGHELRNSGVLLESQLAVTLFFFFWS